MSQKKTNKALFWVFVIVAIGCLGYVAYHLTLDQIEARKSAELQDQVFLDSTETGESSDQTGESSDQTDNPESEESIADESIEEETSELSSEVTAENPMDQPEEEHPRYEYTETYRCAIDFDELHRVNPDIYGWIVINHMDISYPLLQHPTEDQHYLVYSYDDTPGNTGSIYTHTNASKTMTDYNTIIYGHNLYQGGWFTDLEKYYDEDFLKEHRDIIIYQEDKALHYTVYAAVVYDYVLVDAAFDFTKEEDRQAFIDSLGQTMDFRSHVMDDMEVTTDDHLITLSTCVSGVGTKRLLVVAALTKVEALPKE